MAVTDEQIFMALRTGGGRSLPIRQLLKTLKVPARSRPTVRRRIKSLAEKGSLVLYLLDVYFKEIETEPLVGEPPGSGVPLDEHLRSASSA